MKQFDLKEYLRLKREGKEPKIVTRDGKPVRIVCTDKKGNRPIVGLVSLNEQELACTFTIDGCHDDENPTNFDLFFASTKSKGWVNVYNESFGFCCHFIYDTEEKASRKARKDNSYVATVPIEWEE